LDKLSQIVRTIEIQKEAAEAAKPKAAHDAQQKAISKAAARAQRIQEYQEKQELGAVARDKLLVAVGKSHSEVGSLDQSSDSDPGDDSISETDSSSTSPLASPKAVGSKRSRHSLRSARKRLRVVDIVEQNSAAAAEFCAALLAQQQLQHEQSLALQRELAHSSAQLNTQLLTSFAEAMAALVRRANHNAE
jgi:hypothetical protein